MSEIKHMLDPGDVEATSVLTKNADKTIGWAGLEGTLRYLLDEPIGTESSGTTTYALTNRASNAVYLDDTSDFVIALPASEDNATTARDLVLVLDCTACDDDPTVTWSVPSGDSITTFSGDTWSGDMNVPEAGKAYVYTFTEITSNALLATRRELTTT